MQNMNIKEILEKYKTDERVLALTKATVSKTARVQLKGLIGSLDAFVASACYLLNHKKYSWNILILHLKLHFLGRNKIYRYLILYLFSSFLVFQ